STAAAQLGIAGNGTGATLNGTALGSVAGTTRLDTVVNATGTVGITRGPTAQPPVDILLVGGRNGVFRTFNPLGDPARAGAYGTLQPAGTVNVRFPRADNDLQFTAKQAALDIKDLRVKVSIRSGATNTVSFDLGTHVLEFKVPAAGLSANDIVTLMQ